MRFVTPLVALLVLIIAGTAQANPDETKVWVKKFGYSTPGEAATSVYACTSVNQRGAVCKIEFGSAAVNGLVSGANSGSISVLVPALLCVDADTSGIAGTANFDSFFSYEGTPTAVNSLDLVNSGATNGQCHEVPAGVRLWGTVTTSQAQSVAYIIGQ